MGAMAGALAGVRVLDLTQGIAGPFGTKQLADHGAEVIKLERPGSGDVMRRAGPFRGDRPDPEQSGLFLYLNTRKKSAVLDLRDPADAGRLRALARGADLLVESFRPGTLEHLGLSHAALAPLNPRLCTLSLSNFGQTGPYRDWELTEITGFALAGPMYQTGLPGREPLGYAEHATLTFAGLSLATIAVALLIGARRSGRGCHVDLAISEAFLAGGERQPVSYFYSGEIPQRAPDPLREQFLMGAYPCKDGYVAVQGVGRGESWWPRVFKMMGRPELSADPRFANSLAIMAHKRAFDELWGEWLMGHTRREIFDAGAEARFPIAPVYDARDIHADPHFGARGVFADVVHPRAGRVRLLASPLRLHGSPPPPLEPAPLLGQHQVEVERVEPVPPAAALQIAAPRSDSIERHMDPATLPLAGVRVLELAEGWAGPMTGMWLADLGAEVIKVEAVQRFDHARGPIEVPEGLSSYPGRRSGPRPYDVASPYVTANRNKLDVTIDLSRPRGVALFKRLVAVSDVVATNMVTGVPEKMGIGYADLRAVRPDLIMLTCSGYGASGPYARRVTMGGAMDGIAGYTWLRHYPDRTPDTVNYSTHTDVVTGLSNALALLLALHHRARTGEGQWVEVSGVEASLHHIPESLVDFALNGRVQTSRGNQHPQMAPHGVYRCAGVDRWIALAVRTDEEWRALCEQARRVDWSTDPRFADAAARLGHRAELDLEIAGWTRTRDATELMHALQRARIPGAAVHDARDHAADPHWKARGIYQPTELPGHGTYPLPTSPWVIDGRRLGIRRRPPSLGEHNREILGGLLGLSDAELGELAADHYIGGEPLPHEL
jgi:crotonobetainyl-CoA:carnitine CoA-transferase CaiB-like acyl-CoA transferase